MTLQSEDMGKLVAGPDGWIEWAGGPRPHPPATVVDVRLRDGRSESSIVSAFARWQHIQSGNDIIAFRPAHREAQPETDEGGEAGDVADELRTISNELWDNAKTNAVARRLMDAALRLEAHPTPEGQTEGAVDLYVPGPIWLEPEITDEDDNPIWTSEVQTIGGHSVIATVHGGSPSEAALRRDVILAALASKGV